MAASVLLAWAAGFGLGGAVLGALGRTPGYSHPLLRGSGGVPEWREGWSGALRTAWEQQGSALSVLVLIAGLLASLLVGIALVDVLTLLLARAASRRPEMAMRAAVGASPRRLIGGLLTEGAVLVGAAGLLGGIVAAWTGASLRSSWPAGAWPWPQVSPARAFALCFAAFALATILCWLFPVTAAWRSDLRRFLAAGPRATPGPAEGVLRKALVVLQIAAAICLLVPAGLLVRGFSGSDGDGASGFEPSEMLTARVDLYAPGGAAYLSLIDRVSAIPGVVDTSAASPGAFLGIGATERVMTLCPEPECWIGLMLTPINEGPALVHAVGPGFFRTIGATLLRGRELGASDGSDGPGTAVISDAFAYRLFPNGDPIGKWIRVGGFRGEPYEVVGVVKQVGAAAVGAPSGPAPAVYLSLLRHPPRTVELAIRAPGDPSRLAPLVRRAIQTGAPGALHGEVTTMESRLASFEAPLAWFGALFAALGLAALLVATSSLYAVTSYGVQRRAREIGIRMAVGATAGDIVRLIVGGSVRVTAMGTMIGMILALALARALQELVPGVDPLDPVVYAPIGLLMAGAALVASYRPARRAARRHPQLSIREDLA